jgi:hypothetical protein
MADILIPPLLSLMSTDVAALSDKAVADAVAIAAIKA